MGDAKTGLRAASHHSWRVSWALNPRELLLHSSLAGTHFGDTGHAGFGLEG